MHGTLSSDALYLPTDDLAAVRMLIEAARHRARLAESRAGPNLCAALDDLSDVLSGQFSDLADAEREDVVEAEETAEAAEQADAIARGYWPDAQDLAMGWGALR